MRKSLSVLTKTKENFSGPWGTFMCRCLPHEVLGCCICYVGITTQRLRKVKGHLHSKHFYRFPAAAAISCFMKSLLVLGDIQAHCFPHLLLGCLSVLFCTMARMSFQRDGTTVATRSTPDSWMPSTPSSSQNTRAD